MHAQNHSIADKKTPSAHPPNLAGQILSANAKPKLRGTVGTAMVSL